MSAWGMAAGQAEVQEAHRLLQAGDPNGALAVLGRARTQYGPVPQAVHMEGLAAKALGNLAMAELRMRESLALDGVEGQMRAEFANNLGNLLNAAGYPSAAEAMFRHALDAFPLAQALIGLGRALLTLDQPDAALAALRRAQAAGLKSPSLSVLMSEALYQTGDRAGALAVLPAGSGVAAIEVMRGRRLHDAGQSEAGVQALGVQAAGPQGAAAEAALCDILMSRRDWPAASAAVAAALRRHPLDLELLRRSAALSWMRGDRLGFAEPLRQAIAAAPENESLRLALASALTNAEQPADVETLLRDGLALAPQSVALNGVLAEMLAERGQGAEARERIEIALAQAPEAEDVRQRAAIIALIAGDAKTARTHTAWMVGNRPLGQMGLALHVSALRLDGEEAWRRLADPGLVSNTYRIATPPGFADLAAFNQTLAQRLRALHSLDTNPLANSVRGGTQIQLDPATESDPVLQAFFAAIEAPLRAHIAAMPHIPGHPLFGRAPGNYRLSGCWSVRLKPGGGRHVNHIHPKGWLSSAYYVTTPPEDPGSDKAGWLAFGQPPYPIPKLEPLAHVRPEPGILALFPSYQWHGVTPFHRGDERLTIAFDVVPTP